MFIQKLLLFFVTKNLIPGRVKHDAANTSVGGTNGVARLGSHQAEGPWVISAGQDGLMGSFRSIARQNGDIVGISYGIALLGIYSFTKLSDYGDES